MKTSRLCPCARHPYIAANGKSSGSGKAKPKTKKAKGGGGRGKRAEDGDDEDDDEQEEDDDSRLEKRLREISRKLVSGGVLGKAYEALGLLDSLVSRVRALPCLILSCLYLILSCFSAFFSLLLFAVLAFDMVQITQAHLLSDLVLSCLESFGGGDREREVSFPF